MQWRIGISLQLSVYICVSESQHHALWNSTWHLSRLGNGCSLFSNSPAPSGRPCSLSHCREITAFPSPYISLSFSLSLVLFPHFCSLFCTLTSLFHSPSLLSYFLAFPLSCTLLPSVSFCFLLSPSLSHGPLGFTSFLSAQLLWDCPWSLDIKISSPHCWPVFPSSRPCNIKVRGDSPAVFNEGLFAAQGKKRESRRGESDVTHSRASEMNALWLNLPFSHLLLFRKSKPCSTAALKLHIKCEGCICRRSTKAFKGKAETENELRPFVDYALWLQQQITKCEWQVSFFPDCFWE